MLKSWDDVERLNKQRSDYPELAIRALPPTEARQMAQLVLLGYKFNCSEITEAGNRWWNCRDRDGKHMSAQGGRGLADVIRRCWERHHETTIAEE